MAEAKHYRVTLIGISPLLMNADNIEEQDKLIAWRKIPENSAITVKGDDRTPGWTWTTRLCHDKSIVGIPRTYIEAALRDAGKKMPFPGGGKETFKRYTQSGMSIEGGDYMLPLRYGDGYRRSLTVKDINAIAKINDFSEHLTLVAKLGFNLYINRVPIGMNGKHVRVRPVFDEWQTEFNLVVDDEDLSALKLPVLENLFRVAGTQIGIGDWRPSAPSTPGSYGRFLAIIKPVIKAGRSKK